jgi:hypothetical protein
MIEQKKQERKAIDRNGKLVKRGKNDQEKVKKNQNHIRMEYWLCVKKEDRSNANDNCHDTRKHGRRQPRTRTHTTYTHRQALNEAKGDGYGARSGGASGFRGIYVAGRRFSLKVYTRAPSRRSADCRPVPSVTLSRWRVYMATVGICWEWSRRPLKHHDHPRRHQGALEVDCWSRRDHTPRKHKGSTPKLRSK